ncbi:isochorismatase [Candidatus Latescibacterota bacterium]
MAASDLKLSLRHQELRRDQRGRAFWEIVSEEAGLPCSETALLLCDVWDQHWSRGATERVDGMVGRMNEVVAVARGAGVQIIHAPSDTMDFYADSPARKRVAEAAPAVPPKQDGLAPWLEGGDSQLLDRTLGEGAVGFDPPLPVDASDQGSDTGETETYKAWARQHEGIEVDDEVDGISDNGQEIYSYLHGMGIDRLLIMGVHTNMCVLGRSFAIRQMVRWGMDVALIRDLTDAMYSPLSPPYVSHEQGTRLVIEYIEKFWCPTVLSGDILSSCV